MLMNRFQRTLVKKDDFLMALILHYLSDNKLKYTQLDQKLTLIDADINLTHLLNLLISKGFIENENGYLKIRVLSLF